MECDLAGCPNPAHPGATIAARTTDPFDGLPREVALNVCAEHHRLCSPRIVPGEVSIGNDP